MWMDTGRRSRCNFRRTDINSNKIYIFLWLKELLVLKKKIFSGFGFLFSSVWGGFGGKKS